MSNFFLKDSPTIGNQALLDLTKTDYSLDVTLQPEDIAYWCVKCYDLPEKELFSKGFTKDHYVPFSVKRWAKIPCPPNAATDYKRDLQFLTTIGLSVYRPNGTDGPLYYISPFASLLYDKTNGAFRHIHGGETAEDTRSIMEPVIRLLLKYVLPGHYWLAFYNKVYLSPAIYNAQQLEKQMVEAEEEWIRLRSYVGPL